MRRPARPLWAALTNSELVWVAGVTLLAACLRFGALSQFPPGLYHDEAFNGLDALRVLGGDLAVFFEANNGREPLFIYATTLSVALLGQSPGAIRVVAALFGTLTIPATYALGKALLGRRIALIGSILIATSFWAINLSRVGFRAVTLPPILALSLWSIVRAARRRRDRDWVLAGALCGAGIYTYAAFRLAALLLIGIVGYLALMARPRIPWRQLLLLAATAIVVASPMLWYGATHWEQFGQRVGQLSILAPEQAVERPWGLLARQYAKSALMFIWRGDFIPRHNLPLRPVLDPLMSVFFLGGVVHCLWRARRNRVCALLLIWTGVMLLSTALAEGAPHFLRAVGVLPMATFFPAMGLDLAYKWMESKGRPSLAVGVVIAALITSGSLAALDYFTKHAPSEDAYYNFEAGAVELAAEVNRFLGQGWQGTRLTVRDAPGRPLSQAFIDRRLWDGWTAIRYLVPDDHVTVWDPSGASPDPDPSYPEVMVVAWPHADHASALELLTAGSLIRVRQGAMERGDLETEARQLYIAYSARPATQIIPRNREQAFDQGISLLGYDHEWSDPQTLRLVLYWRCERPIEKSYTVLVHARRGSEMIGQGDSLPAGGRYPTDIWRPGDIVADEHIVSFSSPHRAGRDQIIAGLYLLETGKRLSALNDNGNPTGDHIVIVLPD